MSWPSRTAACGELKEEDVGKRVALCGWVHRQRNMGGLVFADIRDHTGIFQVPPLLYYGIYNTTFTGIKCTTPLF